MYSIACSEIWGGTKNEDLDACTSGIVASLYSSACDGSQGGDVYYISVCDAGLLTRIAIADVFGHGQRVSQVGQWLYNALQRQMNSGDGNAVLKDLNQQAADYGDQAMATAAVAGFYRENSVLYFSYAGHPPALVRRKSAPGWQPAGLIESNGQPTHNIPLGVTAGTFYDQSDVPLAQGDLALLYTDGLVEAPSPEGEQFGQERLLAALEAAGDADPRGVKRAALDAVRKHTGGQLSHDDVTLIAFEVL
jgi:sigma-B regulation protein RsbU (phosphoserine phosphatase)